MELFEHCTGKVLAAASVLLLALPLSQIDASPAAATGSTTISEVAPPSGSPSASGPVFTAPSTIPTDCSVDVTKALNQWIASVPDHSTLSFSPGGCYRIEKTVLIKNRNGLTLEGNGATFRAFTDGTGYVDNLQTRNHFYLWGGSDLTVRDVKVQGVNTDHRYHAEYAGQRGFRIAGVQGALIERVSVFEVRGDFVEVDPDYYQTWRWSSDVTVRDSTFQYSGRQGFTITGGRRILFQNNRLSEPALSSFDIEPDSGTSQDAQGFPTYGGAADVRIVDNEVGPGGILFFGNVVLDETVVTKNIEISRNRLRGIALNVWSVGHAGRHYKNFTITDNVSDRVYAGPRGAIELVYVDGAVISGNKVPFYAASVLPMVAVRTWGSSGITVSDNRFPGADAVMKIDKARFGVPWTGTTGGSHTACGNYSGVQPAMTIDAPCPALPALQP